MDRGLSRRAVVSLVGVSALPIFGGCSVLSADGSVDLIVYNHTPLPLSVTVTFTRENAVVVEQRLDVASDDDDAASVETRPVISGVDTGTTFDVMAEVSGRDLEGEDLSSSVSVDCISNDDPSHTVIVDIEPDTVRIGDDTC